MSISSSPTPSEIGKRKRKPDPCNTGIADLRTGVLTQEEEELASKVIVEFKADRKPDPWNTGIADLRTGVWIQEEEELASKVIVEFKAGRLPGVNPKCTLIRLLAQKLHCGGIRILKKFGGLCSRKVSSNLFSINFHHENNVFILNKYDFFFLI